MKADVDSILARWETHCKNDLGKARFSASTRKEILDVLAEMLSEVPIDYDEAKSLKKEVIRVLITKEGLKGAGKYKGWKESTEKDFLASLFDAYNSKNLFEKNTPQVNEVATKPVTHKEYHPLIDIWGKEKFKELWGGELRDLANQPESSLHDTFLDEFFG
jgi:hypothetical protein